MYITLAFLKTTTLLILNIIDPCTGVLKAVKGNGQCRQAKEANEHQRQAS